MSHEKTKLMGGLTGAERRREPRHEVQLNVNYGHGNTYLYSKASNISEMGIFIVTDTPLAAGTHIRLRFDAPSGGNPIEVSGEVVWIDPGNASSPTGMGIRFTDPDDTTKTAIRSFIRTIAYID